MNTPAPANWIILPLLAQVGWTFLLYAWLTVVRVAAVRRGTAEFGTYEFSRGEPPEVARISKNLGNQFELPPIFFALVILLIVTGRLSVFDVAAAWVFVAGRVLHTGVQTLTGNVPLRGAVFTINFLAVIAVAAHLALAVLRAS